jgi:hypothetical protein
MASDLLEVEHMMANREQTRRAPARARAVGGSVAAAVAVWALFEIGFGMDLRPPAVQESAMTSDIGPIQVIVAAGVASLAGWGSLAALERVTARPGRVWTAVAVLVLAASLGGPFSGAGIDAADRAVLALLHVTVGAVLIPLLRRTTATRTRPAPAAAVGSAVQGEAA